MGMDREPDRYLVYFSAMADAHDEDHDPRILDPRDHAIVAAPPPPIAAMLAGQRGAERSGIFQCRDPLFQRPDDAPGLLLAELAHRSLNNGTGS